MRSPDKPFADQGGVVVLAHRGWRGRFPENTMLAFEKAAELPIDGLELDIHSTADQIPVVSHDATVDRTTNGHGAIRDFTLAELKKLDAGYRWTPDEGQTFPFRGQGMTIPTLAEVLARFPDLWINIDIKQHEPSIIRPFTAIIRDSNLAGHLCVGSFDPQTVADFRRACPDVAKSGSKSEVARMLVLSRLRLERFYWGQAHVFQIPEVDEDSGVRLVTPRFVRAAHRNRVAIHVWTVNETAEMQRFIEMGVDGFITDHPDRLLKLLGRL
jgi:glycerophosphoryl diester phosphodiesterase